ncbi:MAG: hypothetical protein F6J86_29205 [Symploca sp. SIO1B1]|nr:hypothetical protein [Symploca sp. SIO1C2]NER97877.1 hypothetical protein [Symploca sp. SIO1B1]
MARLYRDFTVCSKRLCCNRIWYDTPDLIDEIIGNVEVNRTMDLERIREL